MIQQLYHVGQHGDADNSFAPNWSPSGLPSYHDADGSHAMTEAEIEEVIDGFVAARRAARRRPASTASSCSPPTTRSSTSSGRRGRTAAPTRWGGSFENRMRFSCDDPRAHPRAPAATTSSSAWPSASTVARDAVRCRSRSSAEIVAWHDERRSMDYVTCGTGCYFDFYPIIPMSLYEQQLGVPFAAALKRGRAPRPRAGREPHPHAGGRRGCRWPPARPTWSPSSAARSPTRTSSPRPATDRADDVRPCISCNQLCWGRRSRDYWISCLVNPSAGREFEWGGDRFAPAATAAVACWSSAAGRPASRRRGSRPSAATA